jgi:hypothetical protein
VGAIVVTVVVVDRTVVVVVGTSVVVVDRTFVIVVGTSVAVFDSAVREEIVEVIMVWVTLE